MNNNKGFTLIELLVVIALLGLIIGIAVPGIDKISSKMKTKSLNTKIKLVEQAAILWGQDNRTLLQSVSNCLTIEGISYECNKISISGLIDDKYLDGDNNNTVFMNPVTNVDLYMKTNCVVYVYKKNRRVYAKFDITGQGTNCTN